MSRDDAVLALVDRLNDEKKNWSFEIVSHLVFDAEVLVLGRLTVDGVTKMAFGTAAISRDGQGKDASIGADLRVAANDALIRAARLFGVGLVFDSPASPAKATNGSFTGPAPEAPVTPENRVTQKQLGMIHGLVRRKNIGRTELGALIHDRFRKTELVTLTKREASEFIDELGGTNGHASP